MGRSGAVLGIIGILLGAGGLGFAFIVWNTQNSIQTELNDTQTELNDTQTELNDTQTELNDLVTGDIWYQYDSDIFSGMPTQMHVAIPNMSIIFELATDMSIHILFTCLGRLSPTGAMYTSLTIRFTVDGVLIQNPSAYKSGTNSDYYSVALQHFIQDFPAGTHNITVVVYSGIAGDNSVNECALCIQSFAN